MNSMPHNRQKILCLLYKYICFASWCDLKQNEYDKTVMRTIILNQAEVTEGWASQSEGY
jgi:hypothetical protein